MDAKAWARCTSVVVDVLRRGAWYPVVADAGEHAVMIDVRGRPVRFARADIVVRTQPPSQWSVVVRTGVLRPTLAGDQGRELVTSYAVCPHCAYRQDLPGRRGRAPSLTCERCERASDVDWSETC